MDRRIEDDIDVHDEKDYCLEPGYIFFSKQAIVIRTVLGSCVSVCLWDRKLRYGGMNHFLYPEIYEATKATPQFGNVATTALLNIMEEAGCKRQDLAAQIFGGGYPEETSGTNIGRENVNIARRILSRKGITVVSEDVEGTLGRKILFDLKTGHVAVLKVHKVRNSDWVKG